MILYIGFCFHYRKVKIINWRTTSSTSNNNSNGDDNDMRTRRQRTNQAVLDESTSAANRAAGDESEERKLEVRRGRIEEVLWTRLIVDDEELGGVGVRGVAQDQDEVGKGMVMEEGGKEGDNAAFTEKETASATVASSREQQQESAAVPTTITDTDNTHLSPTAIAPSSPFRKYTNALSCNNTLCNPTPPILQPQPPTTTASSTTSTITLHQIHQTYGEECNICLSPFQLGDTAAWSKHHFNGCVHVFHEECMKRWLLVRDGCPICRRSYLEVKSDDGGDLESGENGIVVAEEEEE